MAAKCKEKLINKIKEAWSKIPKVATNWRKYNRNMYVRERFLEGTDTRYTYRSGEVVRICWKTTGDMNDYQQGFVIGEGGNIFYTLAEAKRIVDEKLKADGWILLEE